MDISVVIPAFNEEHKIKHDVETAARFFVDFHLGGEVIVVDDGSLDRTADAAQSADIPASAGLQVIRMEKNSGKGLAVRTGILASEGDIILFADSGTCIPYANAVPPYRNIKEGIIDIALASRRHEDSVICRNRSLKRRWISWLFRIASILVVGVPVWISDSQCGFKLYRGSVAKSLFGSLVTTGYVFELEILMRALSKGCRIEEFPVEWSCDLDTRMRPGHEALSIMKDIFRVRRILAEE